MTPVPSSTWFSAPPHWHWLIILYFFLGGLAGGCYFLAATIDVFGRRQDRPLARLGYYLAFPCVLLSGLLLTVDLDRPLRFWHMLVGNNTFRPMFKFWSPMSVGSWALLVFGAVSFVSFLAALADDADVAWPGLRHVQPMARQLRPILSRLRAPAPLGLLVVIVGGAVGVFISGYTGVLLSVTNRPIWSDTPLLGMLFIVSAASTSEAAILLIAHRAGWRVPGMADLHRLDTWVLVIEFLVLLAMVGSLGAVATAWISAWGLSLVVGVILIGMALPLAIRLRPLWLGDRGLATYAALVLVGGFLLRVIIVMSAESV